MADELKDNTFLKDCQEADLIAFTDWFRVKADRREILELQLGWDNTDFGHNDFKKQGLLLFNLSNGLPRISV